MLAALLESDTQMVVVARPLITGTILSELPVHFMSDLPVSEVCDDTTEIQVSHVSAYWLQRTLSFILEISVSNISIIQGSRV